MVVLGRGLLWEFVMLVSMMSMQMVELTAMRLVMILVMVADQLEFWVTRNPSKVKLYH